MREKEALEQAQLAREREQAQRDFEMVRELQRSTAAAGALDEESNGQQSVEDDGQDAAPAGGDTSGGAGPGTRIKIRDKSGKDVLLRVAATTSIRAVIENYRKLSGLDSGARVTLEFDDEALDPNATIGDTEIEDDDMLTAFCQ
ncbi:hypothetical protein LPJ61_006699 [Coemansia biformis]|uniref:Rad60/SUMO-like domain-containing protein n=1 Tax=Coemansia biformis TaxID=1286918 RepID=A0A9W8CMD4_9FUNG|nr:hypothetical protein LPJ61_006699 [Coemansia biformis]